MKLCDFCTVGCASSSPFQRPQHRPYSMQESLVIWCVLPLLSPPLHHSYLSFPVDGSVFNSPESTPKSPPFSECCYTRVWHPCFSTITGPLVRFWRVWVGDIFGLKVCIPLEVVPIDFCRLNDSIPPHKPASWLSHHNWPLGPLLEVLGRRYLQIEGVYSSCSCTH